MSRLKAIGWRQVLTVLAGLALCGPLAIAVAALSGIGHRWVDILAQFTAPALIAAIAITLGAALLRLRTAATLAGAVVLLLVIAGWPQWAPPKGVAKAGAPVVTVYSSNIFVGNTDVAAMHRSIAAANADIVVMVEVGPEAAARLPELTAGYEHVLMGPKAPAPHDDVTVVASRWPVRSLGIAPGDISALGARVNTPIGPLNVVGAHLTRPWPYQYQWGQIIQATTLQGFVAALEPGPVVVVGDFNSVSSARIGRQIKRDRGLIPAPGWPGTWPSGLPAFAGITIDQVYRSPDLALVERKVGQETGSDHRPVITRLTLAAPTSEQASRSRP